MDKKNQKKKNGISARPMEHCKNFCNLISIGYLVSLVLQLYLTDQSLTNFFSYFTVLCNLLIAVSLTFSSLAPTSVLGQFFSRFSVQSAIGLYIFIVCLVYNLVLRGILTFTGWQLFVDIMLHVVVPILYLLYWAFFRKRGALIWRDAVLWILFPLLYLIFFNQGAYRKLVSLSFPYWLINLDMLK